jgi:hypothetical protein
MLAKPEGRAEVKRRHPEKDDDMFALHRAAQ